MTGQTLGHYQVLEKLGAGGMGEVYKARDTHLNRMVAIKLLRAERMVDAGRKQRFIQEAQAASSPNHPNIVVILAERALASFCRETHAPLYLQGFHG